MTDMTPARLAELKAVAEAATNSAWEQDEDLPETVCASWDGRNWHMDAIHEEDATHIATFDPPTVLRLIAELEAKTAENVQIQAENESLRAQISAKTYEAERLRAMGQGLIKQRDEARAAIERVREAASEVTNQGDNLGRTHYDNCWKQHLHCLAAKIIHETGADDD